jgi:hypothetical protein
MTIIAGRTAVVSSVWITISSSSDLRNSAVTPNSDEG